MNLKLLATRNRAWTSGVKYKVNFIELPGEDGIYIYFNKRVDGVDYTYKYINDTCWNPPKQEIRVHTNDSATIDDMYSYSKKDIKHFIKEANKILSASVKFDENEFPSKDMWTVDTSNKLYVKLSKPSNFQVFGIGTLVNTDIYKVYDKDGIKDCFIWNVLHEVFVELDIVGCSVEVDGKRITRSEAREMKAFNSDVITLLFSEDPV